MKINRLMKEIVRSFYVFMVVTLATCLTVPATVLAGDLPSGPNVQVGNPTIATDGNEMTINAGQHDKTWIDWQGGFNIGTQNTVNNIGPSAAAVMLHNDVSGAISSIQGVLNGNCNVFLLNANGVLFSPTASVNVGGLVTSTLMMSHEDFLSGNYVFKSGDLQNPAAIVNAGTINAFGEGGVTMMGGAVKNLGVINVNLGNVNLISGEEVTLNVTGNGTIQAKVDKEILNNVYDQDGNRVNTGVENTGTITANGSNVYMETGAVKDVFDTLINQEGIIKAGSMVERDGKIILVSESEGIVQNTGTLDASAIEVGADGGEIKVIGDNVRLFGNAVVDASGDAGGGTIEIGGNYQGAGPDPNSRLTVVGKDVDINADAGTTGDGGTVVVWSDGGTYFLGDITSKGGSTSGDGGFVEVSGKENLNFNGYVDTTAANGQIGELLLDPDSIIIRDYNNGNPAPTPQDGKLPIITYNDNVPAGTWSIGELAIENAASNIVLAASGNITIENLTDNQLEVRRTNSSKTLSIYANWDDGTSGSFSMDASDTIDAAGITIYGSSITAGTLNSWGGNIALVAVDGTAPESITVNGNIVTGGGNFDVSYKPATPSARATQFTSNGTITTSGGAIRILTTGAVVINNTINTTGSTAGDIDIDGNGVEVDSIDINSAINSGGHINLDTDGTAITLAANLTAVENIDIKDALTLGGPVTIAAGTGTITVANNLNAGVNALTLTADEIDLNGGAGSVTGSSTILLQPSAAATTIGIAGGAGTLQLTTADIGALANGFSSLTIGRTNGTGAITVNAVTFNDPVTIQTPNSGGSITVNGQITGSDDASITLDGSGATTTLNADIITAGNPITISDAVIIGSPALVALNTTNGAPAGADVTINGPGTINDDANPSGLTIIAGEGDVNIAGAIGATVPIINNLTITGNDITLANIGGTAAGVLGISTVTATDAGVDNAVLTLGGTAYNANQQDYTSGTGGIIINAGAPTQFTSTDNTTFTGPVTTSPGTNLTVTSTSGSLDFNGDLSGAGTINLDAPTGNIALQTVGTVTTPTLLDLDSLTAELGGATITTAGGINFDDVGTTNLATNVTMTSGGNDIDLGTSFEDSHNLTLVAGTGNVDLEAGNIDGLTVTSSATTDIAGTMVVDGDITVAATDTINVNGVVNSTSGSVGLTVTDTDDDDVATINVAANVIGDNVTITAVDANSTSEQINITSPLNNNRGGYTFEANDGTLDIDSNILASDFIALNGVTAINLAADLIAVNNININDALTLDGATATRTIESASGDVTFTSTIDDDGLLDHSLIVNAASGLADFNDTVGDNETLVNLTVAAQNVEFNDDVTVDNDLILINSENILLDTNDITLTATAGDVLFNPVGQLDGDQGLEVIAGNDVTFGTIGATTPLTSLDLYGTVGGTLTLNNDIIVAGDIDLGDNEIDLAGNVSITSIDTGDIYFDEGTVYGAYDLDVAAIDGDIWFSEVGLKSLTAIADGDVYIVDTIIGMGVVDLINIDASGGILVGAPIESASGAITLTGGMGIGIANGLTLQSATNFTITGAVDFEQDATLTSNSGNLTIANAITSTGTPGAIILNATQGNLAINNITNIASLDANASTATLNGTTITTAGTIDFDDVGTTNLASDVVMTSGGKAAIHLN